MMCRFDPNKCSAECKKYSVCSYYSVQSQFSNIQSQINLIYETITKILQSNETADSKLNLLESAIYKYVIKNDSEMNLIEKESKNEKDN